MHPLIELARAFGRLGMTAFGGAGVHLALFRAEFVTRRKWISSGHYMDLLGAANLLPGPTSTEVAIGIGREHAGWSGMLVAGVSFILPASLVVLLFAVLYERLGALPQMRWLLYGIQPVVVAIIIQALASLAPIALRRRSAWLVAAAALALAVAGVHPLVLLGGGALAMLLVRRTAGPMAVVMASMSGPRGLLLTVAGAGTLGLAGLFLTFLGIGALTFGSGYLLLAFLHQAFVEPGLLTNQQLLDAVAVGQMTPGPLFTTATFIGYLLEGVPGAVVATVAIFLPAFLFVGLLHPYLARMRRSPLLATALDGVNAAALGLLAAVAVVLARSALVDAFALLLAILAGIGLWRGVSPVLLLLGGGASGLLVHASGLVA
jgi:chromate transporter